MAYNLERFEVFVVPIPRTRRVVGYSLVASALAGVLTAGVLLATDGSATTALPVLDAGVPTGLALAAAFAGATLLGGESIHLLVAAYPRNWSQFLALVGLVVAGVCVPAAFLLGGSPAVTWFALGCTFLFTFQVLVVSADIVRAPLHALASAVQPAALFVGLTVATPLSASLDTHAPFVTVVLGVGVALVLVSAFVELLMRANVPEVRAFEITAHLVQRKPLHLGMGLQRTVPVQTFAVDTGGERTRIAAPWVHPGVLEGVGGARLTPKVLAALNGETGGGGHRSADRASDGGSRRGFFWHVPSTHLSDSPDPAVDEPVLDAVDDPETTGRASRLVSRTYDGTTFHGRRYRDKRVVFYESDDYADIDIEIFGEVVDPERTLVVDRHARVEDTGREEVYREAPDTETLRGYLRDFLDVLEEQPLADYRAGDALDIDVDGISLYALVEVVDGQRTACIAADRNERPHALVAAREELVDEYDEVLLFTTDTHASVTENRFDPQTRPDQVRDLVATADAGVTDAEAGLTAERAEVELLRSDYPRLMFTLNVLARVYIVSLAGLYVALAVGLGLA